MGSFIDVVGLAAGMVAAVTLLGGLLYLAAKAEGYRRRLGQLSRLQDAYDQLDRQAKLIIRTDLELQRAQEELDRRLASLMSLHQLGRHLQVSLPPEEIFRKVDPGIVTNFGFARGLVGLCASFDQLAWCSLIGVDDATAERLRAHLLESGLLQRTLAHQAPQLLQADTASEPAQRRLVELLEMPTVVLTGILPQAGPAGCLILSHANRLVNAKADLELVAILATQLAVAVENSSLFERTWMAQRELEQKVQERTRELAEANERLLRLNKAKSDFVSAVSHELRTPLAAIKGYASLLASGQFGPLATAQRDRTAKIERHADWLTQFINNLLDIARIDAGRMAMERTLLPLEPLLAAIHDAVAPQMEAKRLRYTVDRDGIRRLLGDPTHLQRVFVNLLSNAIKYTPEGGAIHLGLHRTGDAVLATVTDTGCGIAPEDQQHLFEDFYRARDPINQQVRGTGLGLALVKRIVEAHGGSIQVRSAPGEGSAFTVSLPVEEEEHARSA
jgi:signal transduction histidine kinase